MNKTRFKLTFLLIVALSAFAEQTHAQVGIGDFSVDYRSPREYTIGGITVSGARNFDTQAIILFSGLTIGEKITIPGDQISQAIKNLWKQKLFDNITISVSEIKGDEIFLDIGLTERARLSRYKFEGVSKGEAESLREKINLITGTIVNENLLRNTSNIIEKYYREKGYLDTKVDITEHPDTLVANSEYLVLNVAKNSKVKIDHINFYGADHLSERKLRSTMKDTKQKNFFRILETQQIYSHLIRGR